jgi:multiple sugar transport system permease protein
MITVRQTPTKQSLWARLASNETFAAYVFLTPNFVGFLVFTLLPVFAALLLSFYEWDILTWPAKFVGFANFTKLLGFHHVDGHLVPLDPKFWTVLWNTVFLMFNIPLCMVASLVTALALNQKLRGVVFFRTVFFLPAVCGGVGLLLLWKWIFNADFGLLNSALNPIFALLHLNVEGPNWLGDEHWVKPAFMLMGFWGSLGGTNMLLYLAGLQNVPPELYEAAEMDGATSWQKFKAVTWPYLSPTTFFILTMSIIGGVQGGFMTSYVLTQGGPGISSTTVDYYIYTTAYQNFEMGYAAAISWVLFVLVFIATLINWKFGGKLVHY